MPIHMKHNVIIMKAGQTSEVDTQIYGMVGLRADGRHLFVHHDPEVEDEVVPINAHPFDPNYGQAHIKDFNLTVNVDFTPPVPPHSTIRLMIGEGVDLPFGMGQIRVSTNGRDVNILSENIDGTFKPQIRETNIPIVSHLSFGIAHSDEHNLDVVVIPREISEPAIFDTDVPDEQGQTSLKTGNLRVNKDGSWSVYGRYGPIAAGSPGSQVPVKVHNPCCTLCGKKVPKRSIEDLIPLEWTGVEIKREGERKEKAYICPDHTHEERMAFMGSAIERGKLPKTRAHCIKVRGEGNG